MDEDVDRNQYLGNVTDMASLFIAVASVAWISTQSRNGCFLQSSATFLSLITLGIAAVLCSWDPFTHMLLDIAIEFSGLAGFPFTETILHFHNKMCL